MARAASRIAAVSHWTNTHTKEACNESEVCKPACVEVKENKNFLHDVIKRVDGLYAIIISDREGIPIVRAVADNLPDSATKSNFLSAANNGFDQAGKLGLGKSSRIICFFAAFQKQTLKNPNTKIFVYGKQPSSIERVIHLNKFPLAVSLIANSKANTGLLLNLEPELSGLIEDLRIAITSA